MTFRERYVVHQEYIALLIKVSGSPELG